ncbi:DUF3244 domain-containing protein [Dysgonomonas sp. 216]|uniref:DUF3244 domain-containing protein n=1 Tax=Dysgonomonas sp. 216 TaxID=2302934 RepID=UPI0013D666BC|nr:DUF3244 domain-containing protein [Dysgonomonas sp. 216]NDW17686.1 DUF3244 domain-containing protein [Dysgonomonas sp. 216]
MKRILAVICLLAGFMFTPAFVETASAQDEMIDNEMHLEGQLVIHRPKSGGSSDIGLKAYHVLKSYLRLEFQYDIGNVHIVIFNSSDRNVYNSVVFAQVDGVYYLPITSFSSGDYTLRLTNLSNTAYTTTGNFTVE